MNLLGYLGYYEEAEQLFNKMVRIDPNWSVSYQVAGFIYAYQGKYQKAIEAFEKYIDLGGSPISDSDTPTGQFGYIHALKGEREEALKILAELQTEPQEHMMSKNYIRIVLKDFDPVFDSLKNLYDEMSPRLINHLYYYKLMSKDLVADPRWNDLMRKMGLPES